MDEHKYFYDQYFFELDRRSQLHSQTTLPMSFLVVLGGGATSFFRILDIPFNVYEMVSFVFLLSSIVPLIYVFYYLATATANNAYAYPANADEQKEYQETLLSNAKTECEKKKAIDTYNMHIQSELIRCAAHNAKINDLRSEKIDSARRILIEGSVLVIAGYIAIILGELFSGT